MTARSGRSILLVSLLCGLLGIVFGATVLLWCLDRTASSASSGLDLGAGSALLVLGASAVCISGPRLAGFRASRRSDRPREETSKEAVARLLEACEPSREPRGSKRTESSQQVEKC